MFWHVIYLIKSIADSPKLVMHADVLRGAVWVPK